MAKKQNKNADEIDLTTFAFAAAGDPKMPGVPGCGGCHPGGGGMEFDRDGKRFDKRLAAEPQLAQSLDGDYYQSKWDKTGVIEADCFICHLPGYNFKERNIQLQSLNFKWATVAASGIGLVSGTVKADQQPKVVYNKRLFNEDGKIVVDLSYPPPAENCVFCHGFSDVKKRGFSWNDRVNPDIHNLQGMNCAHCHPSVDDKKLKVSKIEHNFAKGHEFVSTVADNLDHTIKTCKECHETGYMGATRPQHLSIRPNHLDKLACEVCHIPALHRAAFEGFDVTTGQMVNYAKLGAKKVGDEFTWRPAYHRDKDGKLWPVNRFNSVFFTNQDKDGINYPLFGRELKKGYDKAKDQLKPKNPQKPEVHTPEQIKIVLTALAETLKGNQRFVAGVGADQHAAVAARAHQLHVLAAEVAWIAGEPRQRLVAQDVAGHIPERRELHRAHLADEDRRLVLHRLADDHGHRQRRARRVARVGECPQLEGRDVDRDRRARGELRQPAHAFQRELDLRDACRERLVQRGDRLPAEHAVLCEPVPRLEAGDARGERVRVAVVEGTRRVGRQVAEPHEQVVQRRHAHVLVARDDLRARRRERRQCRHRRRGQCAVARQHLLEPRVDGERRLGGVDQRIEAILRHGLAQPGDEPRIPGLGAVVRLDVLGAHAAEAHVGEKAQHGSRERDVGASERVRAGL